MMKKLSILLLVLLAGVSPLLPRVFADTASWTKILVDRVWEQDSFRVERLTLTTGVSDPQKRNGLVYVSQAASTCENLGLCEELDLTLLENGKLRTIKDVDHRFLNATFVSAQKGQFSYFVKSDDKKSWGDIFFVDVNTGASHLLTSLQRKPNELSFVSLSTSGDRAYFSVLRTDATTKQVKGTVAVQATTGSFENHDVSFKLNAPWQQVMDAYNDKVLVKLQFSGGNKQLWIVNSVTQEMFDIPNTWTDPQGDISFAKFQTNGLVTFVQNYRVYTYNPATKAVAPVKHATVNWLHPMSEVIKAQGNNMLWVDDQNILWHLRLDGSVVALNAGQKIDPTSVHLTEDGYVSFLTDVSGVSTAALYKMTDSGELLKSSAYAQNGFLVTDSHEPLLVGVDQNTNIWFHNLATGERMKLGFGSSPLFTDANHVVWKGKDGAIYQATLPAVLTTSVSKDHVGYGTRIKSVGDARVYVIGPDDQLHWIASETVAYQLFGSSWNKDIEEVQPTYLWRYANGVTIDSVQAFLSL